MFVIKLKKLSFLKANFFLVFQTNEFSANYLLATGLANRPQSTVQTTPQSSSSTSTNRLVRRILKKSIPL